MRIASISAGPSARHVGCVVGEYVIDLTEAAAAAGAAASPAERSYFDSVESLIAAGAEGLAVARSVLESVGDAAEHRTKLDNARLLSPLHYPSQVVAVGRNYSEHASEASVDLPELPRLFSKLPSTVIGDGDAIVKPARTSQLDWEVELAVVIGRSARRVPVEQALDYVFGYTILNDVSARDIQFSKPEQLTLAKNFRTFSPIGAWIVTADEIPDPSAVTIRTFIDGELMQSSAGESMIFDIPALISFMSEVTDLSQGDVISTGTPSGVGIFREPPVFLQEGTQIFMDMLHGDETLCRLANHVVAEPTS